MSTTAERRAAAVAAVHDLHEKHVASFITMHPEGEWPPFTMHDEFFPTTKVPRLVSAAITRAAMLVSEGKIIPAYYTLREVAGRRAPGTRMPEFGVALDALSLVATGKVVAR